VELHVACAADEAYVAHCAAMLHSLLVHHRRDDVIVHFLHAPSFSATELALLTGHVERNRGRLVPHAIDDDAIAGLPAISGIPRVMWYRVFLPELLPDVDRVLYLDADTLVVDRLDALWSEPLEGSYVAAVPNVLESQHAAHPSELGLPPTQPYFNRGVLLFNLAAMRADGCTDRIVAYARNQTLRWPDQDALNVVLGARCRSLAPRWNCMNSVFLLPEAEALFGADAARLARDNPAIVHFEGPVLAKPWHYLSKHPYRWAYASHRAATPWPDIALTGRTWGNRLLKPLSARATMTVLSEVQRRRGQARARITALHGPTTLSRSERL
jgi:lipopolysaccharide biosynthesis glycosyltransferase